MTRLPTILMVVFTLISADWLHAADRSDAEQEAIVKSAQRKIIADLNSPDRDRSTSVRHAGQTGKKPKKGLLRILTNPFNFGSRAKSEANEPTKVAETPRAPSSAKRKPRQIRKPAGATTRKKPELISQVEKIEPAPDSAPQAPRAKGRSPINAWVSRILVKIGLSRKQNPPEPEVLLAETQKPAWMRLLAKPQAAESAPELGANRPNPGTAPPLQANPEKPGKGWLGGLLSRNAPRVKADGGEKLVAHAENPRRPKGLANLIGRSGGADRKIAPETQLAAVAQAHQPPAQNTAYRAITPNRVTLHLLDTGSENSTIPYEVDGGKVGRVHGSGDEWSWLELESGLMGVMRNKYLRDARQDEVLGFLADEIKASRPSVDVQVADVDPAHSPGSAAGDEPQTGIQTPPPTATAAPANLGSAPAQ